MEQVRVRFAPSPTGYLHIGGARTALFNWLFAQKNGGKFILRIEDTDTARLKEDSVSQILTSLRWLGINWDEGPEQGGEYGPYYQSERQELYLAEAERLVNEGKAYYCFCQPDELEAEREKQRQLGKPYRYTGKCTAIEPAEVERRLQQGQKPVIRLKVPPTGTIIVNDLIHGSVRFQNEQLDDFVIIKSNGMPAYNFACVVDDYAMKITHVMRAEEHLSNTPKQIHIYQALGYSLPAFAHMPMILAPDRSKLSKRHGATSVEEFRGQGFLAPTIINYLALLGWSPKNEQEVLSINEILAEFTLENVSKKAAVYDVKKLTWMNGLYLNSIDIDEISGQAIPFMISQGLISNIDAKDNYDYIKKIVAAVRERVKTLAEVADAAQYFFKDVEYYDAKGIDKYFKKEGTAELLAEGSKRLKQLTDFNLETTERVYRELIEEKNIKGGDIIHPTRLALTGKTMSPGLFDVMVLLGKETCLKRLAAAIRYIDER